MFIYLINARKKNQKIMFYKRSFFVKQLKRYDIRH